MGLLGQQLAHFGLWSESRHFFNPAMAGLNGQTRFIANYRNQWTGIEGRPLNMQIGASTDVPVLGIGMGTFFERENIGNREVSTLGLHINRVLVRTENQYLRLGIRGSWRQFTLDRNAVITPEGIPSNPNDDFINALMEPQSISTLGIGLAGGFGSIQYGLSFQQAISISQNVDGNYEPDDELFIHVSYNFEINNSLHLRPRSVFYTNFSVYQWHLALEAEWNDRFIVGLGYRGWDQIGDSAALIFGLNFAEHVKAKYLYELGVSELARESNGSHEIILIYSLNETWGKWIEGSPVYSPRTF
jgi:type IX secretion system PorP/SprF family membrane protein